MPSQGQIVHRFGRAVLIRPPMMRAGPGRPPEIVAADPASVLLGIASQLRADIGLDVAVIALGGPGIVLTPGLPPQWDRVMAAFAGLHVSTVGALEGRLSTAESVLAAVLDFRIGGRTLVFNGYCVGVQAACLHPRLSELCAQARDVDLSPHAPITAPEALGAGMLDAMVEPDEAVTESLRWAQRSVGWPVAARTMAKLAINGHAMRRPAAAVGSPACYTNACSVR